MLSYIYLFKTLHLIGAFAWIAGLFYLIKVLIYHSQALKKEEPNRSILVKQYNHMEWRIYRVICNPAMMITWTFGVVSIAGYGMDWFGQNGWLHIKVLLLIFLTAYHVYCKMAIKKLEKAYISENSISINLLYEVPLLVLIATIALAVYKNAMNYTIAGLIIVLFAIILIVFRRMNKSKREKSHQK